MAFEGDQLAAVDLPAPTSPVCERQGQRGQQRIVGTAVEPRGDGGERRLGHIRRNPHPDASGGGDDVSIRVERAASEQPVAGLEDLRPSVQFGRGAHGCLLDEAVDPTADRRRRQAEARHRAPADLVPGGDEVGEEDAPGDPVDGQMVDDQPHQVGRGAVGVLHPHEPHQDAGAWVESIGRGLEVAVDLVAVPSVEPHVLERLVGVDRTGWADHHVGLVGEIVDQRGPEDVVPVEHRAQCAHQFVAPGGIRELDQRGLSEPVDGTAFEHRVHDRRQRDGADGAAGQLAQSVVVGDIGSHRGQRGDGLVLEHILGREREPARLRPRHELDGQDAVAAEDEEAVVGTHLDHPEYLGEELRQSVFPGSRRRPPRSRGCEHGRGQGSSVDLAERIQRQGVEDRDDGRDQMRRQALACESLQLRRFDPLSRRRHHVRRQDGRAGEVERGHGDGLVHLGVPGESGVDLTGLDPVPTDLQLEVGAAQQLQRRRGPRPDPAGEIAGPVHPFARRAVRVGHETCRGLTGQARVAASQPRAGEVQLACGSHRHRLQCVVEDHHRRTADGAAHRDVCIGLDHRTRRRDRRLGRPVLVDHRRRPGPPFDHVRGAPVAADDDGLHPGERLRLDGRQHRGREGQVGDLLLGEQLGEPLAADHLRRHNHQGGSGCEAGQQLFHRRIEARGERVGDPGRRREAIGAGAIGDETRQPGVGDLHALRHAGRTGRVGHVRDVLEPDARRSRRVVEAAARGAVGVPVGREVAEVDPDSRRGHPLGELVDGDRRTGTAVGEDVLDALTRVFRIHLHDRGTGLRHRPDGHDGAQRPSQQDRDRLLRSAARGEQAARESRRGGVEFAIRHRTPGRAHCRRLSVPCNGFGENVGEYPRRGATRAPHGEQCRPLMLVEQRELSHAIVGRPAEEGVQEHQEATVVPGELVRGVDVRVALEVDVRAALSRARVDVDEQIGRRTRGQYVQPPGDLTQHDLAVDHHEVHRRPEGRRLVPGHPHVREDVLLPVALPPQSTQQLPLHGGHHVAERAAGDRHTQRHDVGHHAARPAQHGGVATRDRKAEKDFGTAGHPREVRGERRDDHRGHATSLLRGRIEQRGRLRGNRRAHEDRVQRRLAVPAGEGHDRRGAVEMVAPVPAVVVVTSRPGVGRVLGDDVGDVARLRRRRGIAANGRVVQLGDPPDHRHRGESVERDVVRPQVPHVVRVPDAVDDARHQVVGEQVERSRVVEQHQPVRCRGRIGLAAQIHGAHRGALGSDVLPRFAIDDDQAQVPRAELPPGDQADLRQQLGVQFAVDVDVLCHRDRQVTGHMLGEPDAALRGGQRK